MSKYKFACTQWGMPGEGLYGVRVAAEAGLDGLQLELGSYENGYPLLQKTVREGYMEDAERYGIAFPSIVLNDLGKNDFVHGRNTEHGKIAYESFDIAVEIAAEMGVGMVMIPNFFNNFITEPEHYDNAAQALQYCCDRAAKYGITVASETVLAWKDHKRILDKVNRDNIGVFFDSMNYQFFSNLDPMANLRDMYPYMVDQLHFKDGIDDLSQCLLGEGEMAFEQQAQFIRDSDYTGWIIFENYYSHLPLRGGNLTDQLSLLKKDLLTMKAALGVVE